MADRPMVGHRTLAPGIAGSSPDLPAMLKGWVSYRFLFGVTHPQQSGTQYLHNVQAKPKEIVVTISYTGEISWQ